MSLSLLFDVSSKLSWSNPLCLLVNFCIYGIYILYEIGTLFKQQVGTKITKFWKRKSKNFVSEV